MRELLSNNSLFVGQLYEDKSLALRARDLIFFTSDFIWPFLRPYMGVIPNPKMAFIFPISCILALIFPILLKYFPKCEEKGYFPKSQINSLFTTDLQTVKYYSTLHC